MTKQSTLERPKLKAHEPRYPADIESEDYGYGRLHRGHNLDPEMLRADLLAHGKAGDLGVIGYMIAVDEVHLIWRWIKNCRQSADRPCDANGRYLHGHWDGAVAKPEHKFTLVRWVPAGEATR